MAEMMLTVPCIGCHLPCKAYVNLAFGMKKTFLEIFRLYVAQERNPFLVDGFQ